MTHDARFLHHAARCGAFLQVLICGRWFLPIITVATIVLVLPSVRAGLHADDHVILGILSGTLREGYPARLDIFNFFDPARRHHLVDLGVLPWWTDPHVQMAFWRPASAVTHWLDAALWPRRPPLMHLQSVLWYGALVAATAFMYRRLLPRAAAVVAAILYAVDGAHAEAVTWISARNMLVGALFGTLALVLYDQWRRDGRRVTGFLGPVCFGLALLSTEGAVAIFAYFVAYALVLERGTWGRRLAALIPCAAVAVVWKGAYTWLGYGVFAVAPAYRNPVREPLQFAHAIVEHGPGLVLAQWTGLAAETTTAWPLAGLGLALVGLIIPLTPLAPGSPSLAFGAWVRYWRSCRPAWALPLTAVSSS